MLTHEQSKPSSAPRLPSGVLCLPHRAYTGLLNVEVNPGRSNSYEPSDITDAGDQAALRLEGVSDSDPEPSHAPLRLTHSLQFRKFDQFRHELQDSILNAYEKSRNDARSSEQLFLPRGQLRRLLNIESVMRELEKELDDVYTSDDIERFARIVCTETKTKRRGKSKIKSYRRIFALLVMLEATSMISLFLNEDVSDLDLPLVQVKAEGYRGFSRKGSTEPLKCFEHRRWSPIKLENFQEYQWKMLAPFFAQDPNGEVQHYLLRERHILPFALINVKDILGGFGRVFMVHIHKDHHSFQDSTDHRSTKGFAVKQQLHDSDREAFQKEAAILKKFTGSHGHEHIISLLATYEHMGKFHLIFPRAEGDLFFLWKTTEESPSFEYKNVLWMAEQCAGIADGLCKLHKHLTIPKPYLPSAAIFRQTSIGKPSPVSFLTPLMCPDSVVDEPQVVHHRIDSVVGRTQAPADPTVESKMPQVTYQAAQKTRESGEGQGLHIVHPTGSSSADAKIYGRHGDINPGNLLWFDSSLDHKGLLGGTLKIADFGQAEFNSEKTKTKPRMVAHTWTYRPPECDLSPSLVRQTYDIWCLGCVYLEFVTWMLGGARLLASFVSRRRSPDYFQPQDTDTFFHVAELSSPRDLQASVKEAVLQVSVVCPASN